MAGKGICKDTRPCFAKNKDAYGYNLCGILTDGFPNGKCKFCKPRRDVTDGKLYPARTHYLYRGRSHEYEW
jgi:hypothetical protein